MKYIKHTGGLLICLMIAAMSCDLKPDESLIIEESASVTDYDGNTYKTIRIGNQIWMAENLKSIHYSDGTPVSNYVYNDQESNCSVYGRLYPWQSVMRGETGTNSNPGNIQGIAPNGWHIPSKAEWQQLINYLGGYSLAGGWLKEEGLVNWQAPNSNATNKSLFCALPGGMYAFWQEFQWLGQHAVFATSTDISVPGHPAVNSIKLDYNNASVTVGEFHPDDAVSVRCVKNQ